MKKTTKIITIITSILLIPLVLLVVLIILRVAIFISVFGDFSQKDPRTIDELYEIYTNNESEFIEVGNILEKYNINRIDKDDFYSGNVTKKDGIYVYTEEKTKISKEDLNTIIVFFNKHEFDQIYKYEMAYEGHYYVFLLLSHPRKSVTYEYFPTPSEYVSDDCAYFEPTTGNSLEVSMEKKINDNWEFTYRETVRKEEKQDICIPS